MFRLIVAGAAFWNAIRHRGCRCHACSPGWNAELCMAC